MESVRAPRRGPNANQNVTAPVTRLDVPGAGSDGSVLRREMEEERAKSSRLERQVEFLEGALDHERQRK